MMQSSPINLINLWQERKDLNPHNHFRDTVLETAVLPLNYSPIINTLPVV